MNGTKRTRNSSVETLRILAMMMIVASHCSMFSTMDVLGQPFGVNKVLIETFLYSGGKIGVVAFFSISAWYLSEAGGVRAGLRRVWILEREMLFWSLVLLAATAFFDRSALDAQLIARSVFPTVTALWWYPTAYAVFLLFFPFLTRGLRVLDASMHWALCLIMIMLWTVLDMIMPISGVGLPGGDVFSFVYIYVLITYYRWHMRPMGSAIAWGVLAGGYALIVAGAIGGGLLYQSTGKLQILQVYLSKVEFRLPVLMVGLALFVLFERHEFYSAAINTVAGSTFGVYLISEYPSMREVLWQRNSWVDFPAIIHSPAALALIVAVVCVVYALCAALDQIRAALFAVTVDRHRGRWFDALYEYLNRCFVHHSGELSGTRE